MIQTLLKNWWFLALCGILDAIISVIHFVYAEPGFHALRPIMSLGKVTLAAGLSTIAIGLWSTRKNRPWLLVLNGLACRALGLIYNGIIRFKISFFTAFLIILMAMSIGILELLTARTLRRHVADRMLVLGLRLHNLRTAIHRMASSALPAG